MQDTDKERYPPYVPAHYRAFVKLRKALRQSSVRSTEKKALKLPPKGIVPDGEAQWTARHRSEIPNPKDAINKSAVWIDEDLARPDLAELALQIEKLKEALKSKGLRYTNTAATFLPRMFYPRSERTKLWENVWTIRHSGVRKGDRVLDIGGASTPFSFYLAHMGCSVAVLDNDWGNCGTLYNADYVGRKMGWGLKAFDGDIGRRFPFPDGSFDKVFSICTIEHLPSPVRQWMMRETARVLKRGGVAAITMCYDPNHRVLTVDKGLRFGYREKFMNDVVLPSGMPLLGNEDLIDFSEEADFLGAVFLRKRD